MAAPSGAPCCCMGFLAGPAQPEKGAKGPLIVLVGMRAAGKSSFARAAARHLGAQLLDLDEVVEREVLKCKIIEYVERHGWPAFRDAETRILAALLTHRDFVPDVSAACVVATGGGVVESRMNREMLMMHRPVLYVDRHIDDIVAFLQGDGSRPKLGTSPRTVYAQRKTLYEKCSDFTFSIRKGDNAWARLEARFAHLASWAASNGLGVPPSNPVCVPIVAETEATAMADIREAAMQGAGMVEIRFDFLRTKVEDIGLRSIPLLLSVCRGVGLPVLATFRPRWEDPNAGYSGQDEPRLQALQLAGHHGAAFVDVERKSMPMWKALGGMPRGMRAPARLVVSDHNFERLDSLDELRALAAEMRKLAGPEGVVKIAQSCGEDITAAARMATLAATTAGPMVCLAMGQGGMFTRILAPKFGALFTFGCLTGKRSAPGQPTVGQMIEEFRVADMTRDTKVLALCTRVKSNRLLTSPSSGRLCTVANAGLAAASVDAMCVPIQLPTGCMREEFEDLLPPGTFVALMMDPIVVTSRLDKAADIYRQVAGAPPGGEALAAMDRSAQ